LQPSAQALLHRFDVFTVFDRKIDHVELAHLAEHALRHRQIHQRETAAKNFRRSLFLEQRAHREWLLALTGQQSHGCAHGEIQPARKRLRERDGIRLSDKPERLIEAELSVGKLIIANGEVGQQIDTVDIQALPRRAGNRQKTLDRRRRIAHARRIANQRKQRFRHAALAVGDLQNSFAGDLIHGGLKRRGQRTIHRRDGHDHGHAESDAEESQHGAQAVPLDVAPRDGGQQSNDHKASV
jgi:hypothetical protein